MFLTKKYENYYYWAKTPPNLIILFSFSGFIYKNFGVLHQSLEFPLE
jgi:hypothetical protein